MMVEVTSPSAALSQMPSRTRAVRGANRPAMSSAQPAGGGALAMRSVAFLGSIAGSEHRAAGDAQIVALLALAEVRVAFKSEVGELRAALQREPDVRPSA